MVALIDALKPNDVLQELNIGCLKPEDKRDVVNALDRVVAYHRVRPFCDARVILKLSANLRVNADCVTSVYVDSSVGMNPGCLEGQFDALTNAHRLKILCIESRVQIHVSAAWCLSRLLVNTSTLEYLRIALCYVTCHVMAQIIDAMAENKFVTRLSVLLKMTARVSIQPFIRMVTNNRTLTNFSCVTADKSDLKQIVPSLLEKTPSPH